MTTVKTRTRYIFSAGIVLGLIVFGAGAWGVVRIVAWAKDLPNRIVIDLDEIPIESIVAEGTRAALMSEDQSQQLQCLEYLAEGSRSTPEVIPWIQSEFAAELTILCDSPDGRVATLARTLTEAIPLPSGAEGDDQQQQP